MISSASAVAGMLSSGTTASSSSSSSSTGFDAALAAAEKAKARQDAQDAELKSIKEKGFTAWVRDTAREKLKEELRKRVMASMGLTEADLAGMDGAMQQILEQKIKDEVEKRLTEVLNNATGSSGSDTGSQGSDQTTPSGRAQSTNTALAAQESRDQTSATTGQAGKKDQDGISCPVIPALAMSGGTPLF